jgi:hypothetical protein
MIIACSARRGGTEDARRRGEPGQGPAEQQRQLRLPGRRTAILKGVAAVGTLAFWREGADAKYIDEWGFEEEGDGSMEDLGLKRQRVSDNIQRMKDKYTTPLPYQVSRTHSHFTSLQGEVFSSVCRDVDHKRALYRKKLLDPNEA